MWALLCIAHRLHTDCTIGSSSFPAANTQTFPLKVISFRDCKKYAKGSVAIATNDLPFIFVADHITLFWENPFILKAWPLYHVKTSKLETTMV